MIQAILCIVLTYVVVTILVFSMITVVAGVIQDIMAPFDAKGVIFSIFAISAIVLYALIAFKWVGPVFAFFS